MIKERDEKLAKIKDEHPEWGRKKLSSETGYPEAYVQRWLKRTGNQHEKNYGDDRRKLVADVLDSLSDREIAHVMKMSGRPVVKAEAIELATEKFTFGYMSDTHIGHSMFDEEAFITACEFWDKAGVDHIYHSGDIVEGMSGRDGHIYEIDLLGFENQVGYAAELFSQSPAPIYGITGNHDQWFKIKGNCGVCVGESLSNRLDHFHFLGEDEAMHRVNGIDIMLRHPGDGSAYALSYKTQKFVESLSGGRKPAILLNGHYHKSIFYNYRNVEVFEAGTLQRQTKFLRSKGSSAHLCVGAVEVWTDGVGIQRIRPEILRFYE